MKVVEHQSSGEDGEDGDGEDEDGADGEFQEKRQRQAELQKQRQQQKAAASSRGLTPVVSMSVVRSENLNQQDLASLFQPTENSQNNQPGQFAANNNNNNVRRDFLFSLTRHPFDESSIINVPDNYYKFYRLPMFLVCSAFVAAAIALATIFVFVKIVDLHDKKKSPMERWLPIIGPVGLLLIGFGLSFLPEKIYITFDRRQKEMCYIRYRVSWWCLSRTAVVKFRHISGIETRESLAVGRGGVKYDEVILKTSKVSRVNPLLANSMMTMAQSGMFESPLNSNVHGNTNTLGGATVSPSPRTKRSVSIASEAPSPNALGSTSRRKFSHFAEMEAQDEASEISERSVNQIQIQIPAANDDDDGLDKEFVLDEVEASVAENCRSSWILYLRSIGVQI